MWQLGRPTAELQRAVLHDVPEGIGGLSVSNRLSFALDACCPVPISPRGGGILSDPYPHTFPVSHFSNGAGAKLFYLSGMRHGKYLKREILNLARFISVMKFRPLSWRMEHPFLVADR